jgi:hypothetical protein
MSTRSGVASSFRRIRSFAPVTGSCSRRELASGRVVFGSDGSASASFPALPARGVIVPRPRFCDDSFVFRRFRVATCTSTTCDWENRVRGTRVSLCAGEPNTGKAPQRRVSGIPERPKISDGDPRSQKSPRPPRPPREKLRSCERQQSTTTHSKAGGPEYVAAQGRAPRGGAEVTSRAPRRHSPGQLRRTAAKCTKRFERRCDELMSARGR